MKKRKHSDLYYDKNTYNYIQQTINDLHRHIYGKEPINLYQELDFYNRIKKKSNIIFGKNHFNRENVIFYFNCIIDKEIKKINNIYFKIYKKNMY
tara:strand:- start:504 stop:788 length:285 start_codon:yes stop_codon:yes gene_type:complete